MESPPSGAIRAAWAVDRLGRSPPNLVNLLSELQARGVDLFLHQQALDTSTPSGRMLFQMLAVFSEFERVMIVSRVRAGLQPTTKRLGRPPMSTERVEEVRTILADGESIRTVARAIGIGTASVQRIKATMRTEAEQITAPA